jgi:hypothetical protein
LLTSRDLGSRIRDSRSFGREARPGRLTWFDWSVAADLSIDGRTLLFYRYGEGVGGRFTTFLRGWTDPSRPAWERARRWLSPQDQKWALVSLTEPDRHLRSFRRASVSLAISERRHPHHHWAFFFPDGRRIGVAGEEKDSPLRGHTSRTWTRAATPLR